MMITTTRRPQHRIALFLSVLLAALTGLIALNSPQAGAVSTGDGFDDAPTRWYPTGIQTTVTNGQAWGDVAYHLNWSAPNNFASLTDSNERTFEIGFKEIRNSNGDTCNRDSFGKSGIPSETEVKWDYSEDPNDAVVWFADMGALAADQRANRSKYYSVWGNCFSDGDYWFDSVGPVLQVQRGHWTQGIQEPGTTFADTTMNALPDEVAYKTFPPARDFDINGNYDSVLYAAWNRDHNFEDGDAAWQTNSAIKTRYCGSAALEGSCYMNVRPSTSGSTASWLYQVFDSASYLKPWYASSYSQYGTGDGNAMQGQIGMRCRASTTCYVDVHLKTDTSNYKYYRYAVPANSGWTFGLLDQSDWAGLPNGKQLQLWVNTRGKSVDLDTLWISSDLVIG